MNPSQKLHGRRSDTLRARVLSRRALLYRDGAQPADDLPAHVRAGSAIAVTADRIAVVQDDTNAVAVIDRMTGSVTPVLLPPGPGGVRQFGEDRKNKKHKLDLEACVFLPSLDHGTLLAFGSGSTPARERVLVLRGLHERPEVSVVPAPALYRALREREDFSGSELNVEGVARVGDALRFVQRGNGAPRGELRPIDATCDVPLAAVLAALGASELSVPVSAVREYDLGDLDGVRLTFTDAWSDGAEPLWFLAAAEDSPDTYHDGVVKGSALGVIEPDGTARWCAIEDERGGPFADKAEGLALDPSRPDRAWVVVDKDDTTAPCELCEIALSR